MAQKKNNNGKHINSTNSNKNRLPLFLVIVLILVCFGFLVLAGNKLIESGFFLNTFSEQNTMVSSFPDPAPELPPESTPEPSPEPTPEPSPEPVAVMIPSTVTVGGSVMPVLSDSDGEYSIYVYQGKEINIVSETAFSMLYLNWGEEPEEWTLLAGDDEYNCGKYGFQHELVRLSTPTYEASIILKSSNRYRLSEITAYSSGSLPDGVQDWLVPYEEADILVLPTHSDDEFIFMGGVIPSYISKGYRVQVAYLVNHRYNERLDSLWVAGVRHYPIVSDCVELAEGLEGTYGANYIIEYQVGLIRRFRPLVIVGHAENGESGHASHRLNVRCLKYAVEFSSDPSKFSSSAEQYGLWDVPKTYLHLYGDNPTILDYEKPLSDYGDLTAFEVAQNAYEACVSQYNIGYYSIYGSDSRYDSHKFGLYRSLVGEDTQRNDLMENIPNDYRD